MKRLLIVAVLIIAGCSATGAKFSGLVLPKESKSVLYIYRPDTFVNGGLAPYLFINDKKKEKLKNGGYQVFSLFPGVYKLTLDGNTFEWPYRKVELQVEAKENEIVFVRVGSSISSTYVIGNVAGATTNMSMYVVKKGIAMEEIINTRSVQ